MRYPAVRHPYLTELIQEFQLGFPLPDTKPKKFLLPGLLPKDEPENTSLEGDTLEFQYHYRILPESILSRFIVLTHEDIHAQTYWRSGVMLHYTEGDEIYNIARVRADPEDKKIFISISGKEATRRAFLALLRKNFNKIHSSFANPDVTEWVPVPDHSDHPPLDYQELLGLERMGDRELSIGKLGIRLNIRKLLDGFEDFVTRQQRRREELGKEGLIMDERRGDLHIHLSQTQTQGDNKPMSTTIHQHGQGDNIGGDKVLGDKIGTQINNNPDLSELLAILTTLRQTSTEFPDDIQENIIINIEDLETEVQKPAEQRSKARLKRSLIALAGVVTLIAAPVAGMADFTNNVLELGEKLQIELPASSD